MLEIRLSSRLVWRHCVASLGKTLYPLQRIIMAVFLLEIVGMIADSKKQKIIFCFI